MVLHDVTELRRLEQVRTEFIANVSHEVRTPLTAILGYLETLLAGALEEPEHAPTLPGDRLPSHRAPGPAAQRPDRSLEHRARQGLPAPGTRPPWPREVAAVLTIIVRQGRGRGVALAPTCRPPLARRRPRPARPDPHQPRRQRREVHAARRPGHRAAAPDASTTAPSSVIGHGRRHSARRPAAHHRALLSRGQGPLARAGRHRASAWPSSSTWSSPTAASWRSRASKRKARRCASPCRASAPFPPRRCRCPCRECEHEICSRGDQHRRVLGRAVPRRLREGALSAGRRFDAGRPRAARRRGLGARTAIGPTTRGCPPHSSRPGRRSWRNARTGVLDQLDVAPTVAAVLGMKLPAAARCAAPTVLRRP